MDQPVNNRALWGGDVVFPLQYGNHLALVWVGLLEGGTMHWMVGALGDSEGGSLWYGEVPVCEPSLIICLLTVGVHHFLLTCGCHSVYLIIFVRPTIFGIS